MFRSMQKLARLSDEESKRIGGGVIYLRFGSDW